MNILRYQFRDKVLIEGSIKRNFWDMKTIKITINHITFLQERSFLNSKVYIITLLFIILLFIILLFIIYIIIYIITYLYYYAEDVLLFSFGIKCILLLSKLNIEYLKF